LVEKTIHQKKKKKKEGDTEHLRSLQPSKAIAMAICPIIFHFITVRTKRDPNALLYLAIPCKSRSKQLPTDKQKEGLTEKRTD